MSLNSTNRRILSYGLILCLLSSCYRPPFNNFKSDSPTARRAVGGTVAGAAVGAGIGSMSGSAVTGLLIGGVAGGALGAAIGLHKETKSNIIKELRNQDIELVQYGDTMTLVVPTDKYFMFNSPRINERCYPGLVNIIKLLKFYPQTPIYVAGFSDNVGSTYHKNLMSQAQAETMMTFLWANDVSAQRLKAEGYGEKNDIADNELIHGSAMNRRIEIQWITGFTNQQQPQLVAMTK